MKQRQETIPDYVKELVRLFDAGKINRSDVVWIDIKHFPLCAMYRGQICDCNPTITNGETGEVLNTVEN
jgi:hypothetical protein